MHPAKGLLEDRITDQVQNEEQEQTPDEGELETVDDCDVAIRAFGEYLSNDLADDARASFVDHIRGCGGCYEKLMALELVIHLAAKVRPEIEDNAPKHQWQPPESPAPPNPSRFGTVV